jgi:hypothetical protein
VQLFFEKLVHVVLENTFAVTILQCSVPIVLSENHERLDVRGVAIEFLVLSEHLQILLPQLFVLLSLLGAGLFPALCLVVVKNLLLL